ncbi:MAG: polysaccharide deacetylase family protein [Lachnospiraceae bacterium]
MKFDRKKTGCLILVMMACLLFIMAKWRTEDSKTANILSIYTLKTYAGTKQNEEQKRVALTFDDGPHPIYTEQLLDGLAERNVKVTFFVTGENASLHSDIILRMYKEGHLIGNHTYSHIALNRNNRKEFREELIKTNQCIEEITGEEVLFVRPPYGSWDKTLEKELNMFPVLWNVDPLDWCTDCPGTVVRRIMANVDDGDIILMHDYYGSSVTAALSVVDQLLEQGYEFVTVDEIILE